MRSDAPPRATLAALALTAGAVLVVEIVLMRALALVAWPPFAYLGVSVAMLGAGVAGTVLAVRPTWHTRTLLPALAATLVAIAGPAAIALVLRAGLEPLRVGVAVKDSLVVGAVLAVAALPFAGLGVALSVVLERFRAAATTVYGADLVGAALGVAAAEPLVDALGVAGASVVAGLLATLAAFFFVPSLVTRGLAVVVGLALLAGLGPARALLPRPTVDKRVGALTAADVIARLDEHGRLVTADRGDARIDVIPAVPAPRLLFDLGAAVTRAPETARVSLPDDDPTSAAFVARPAEGARVLVLGSGAGYEVARALSHGASSVDAVEIASGVVELVRSPALPISSAVYADPRVRLHHAEARAFVEHRDERFDHIIAIHTITNAAFATGAMRLVEDFLLTRESLSRLYRALSDDGVLYLTRPKSQIPLLVATMRAALVDAGTDEAAADAHLVVLGAARDDPFFGGLLVFRRPPATAPALPAGLVVVDTPRNAGLAIPTDDRPFFHRLADPVDDALDARLQIEGPRLAERAVSTVALLGVLFALLVIAGPLLLRRRERSAPPPFSGLVVATLLGLAFLLVELPLAQRFTLTVGRPLTAFAVVTAGMLLGAGGTALLARDRAPSLPASLLLAVVGAMGALVLPFVVDALAPDHALLRLALPALAAAVVAAPLGLPFPALVRASVQGDAGWLYAMNAVAGVFASAVFALFAPTLGLVATSGLGAALYAAALGTALVARAAPRDDAPPPSSA